MHFKEHNHYYIRQDKLFYNHLNSLPFFRKSIFELVAYNANSDLVYSALETQTTFFLHT